MQGIVAWWCPFWRKAAVNRASFMFSCSGPQQQSTLLVVGGMTLRLVAA